MSALAPFALVVGVVDVLGMVFVLTNTFRRGLEGR
jgi:hypothetical protein